MGLKPYKLNPQTLNREVQKRLIVDLVREFGGITGPGLLEGSPWFDNPGYWSVLLEEMADQGVLVRGFIETQQCPTGEIGVLPIYDVPPAEVDD